MYSLNEYNKLVLKYGSYASWAIWDYENESDSSIIEQNINKLHSRFVLIGLNISKSLKKQPWVNFHGGRHDRKLKYACNNTKLYGSYITDIFKDLPESNSNNIKNFLTDNIIKDSINFFNKEMIDVRANNNTQFIIFGMPNSFLARCFNTYFKQHKNRIIYYYHYSYYGITDKKWVQGIWKKLGINQNYDLIVNRYMTK